jgi:stage V sporulation protein AE
MQEIIRDLSLTFLMGGTVCVLAQLLIDLTRLTPARILVLLVSSGVLLYGVGVYEPLYGVFGAGVSVPLLGFGANIAKGVREAVDTDGVIGILTGGLTASAGGITAALILGLLASLVFRPRPKRM